MHCPNRELLQYLFCALRWASEAASSVLDFHGASHFKFPDLIHTIMLHLAKSIVVLCNQNTYVHSEVPLNVPRIDAVQKSRCTAQQYVAICVCKDVVLSQPVTIRLLGEQWQQPAGHCAVKLKVLHAVSQPKLLTFIRNFCSGFLDHKYGSAGVVGRNLILSVKWVAV